MLPEPILQDFRNRASTAAHPREMVIDLLRAIQEQHRWVADEGVELTAEILGIPVIEVEEVATFYDKIFRQPVGRHVIHVCDSICCWSRGGEEIAGYLQQQLDIALGETTADGAFTLLPTCCLGACDEAPAMMIDRETYGNLTEERIDKILEQKRKDLNP
ncbi:NADH-quinone oxidoreductase subunit NuoE [Trichloromonas sp.]|uniref:NADH-quinone oxidoreductase subunit NuoE n=1 Tax=Trichloromonas sp. TaxID=3069249 RepID=UPI003D814B2A